MSASFSLLGLLSMFSVNPEHLFFRAPLLEQEFTVLLLDSLESYPLSDMVEEIWGQHPGHVEHPCIAIIRIPADSETVSTQALDEGAAALARRLPQSVPVYVLRLEKCNPRLEGPVRGNPLPGISSAEHAASFLRWL